MQLVINTRGSYLRKKGNCFLVKRDDEVFEVSVNKVDSILITTSAQSQPTTPRQPSRR